MTIPASVSEESAVLVGDSDRSATVSTAALASPKSSSFAPVFVSITFAGFRSRWMIPS